MYKLTTAKRCSSDSAQITFRPPSSCSHRSVIWLFSYVSLVFAKSDLRKDWTTLSGTWSKQTTRKQGGGYQLQFAVPSILIITKSDQLCIHYWKPKFFCVPDYFSDGDEWAHRKMLNFLSVWFTHRKIRNSLSVFVKLKGKLQIFLSAVWNSQESKGAAELKWKKKNIKQTGLNEKNFLFQFMYFCLLFHLFSCDYVLQCLED